MSKESFILLIAVINNGILLRVIGLSGESITCLVLFVEILLVILLFAIWLIFKRCFLPFTLTFIILFIIFLMFNNSENTTIVVVVLLAIISIVAFLNLTL